MKYKFLILGTYHPDTLYLHEQRCEDLWLLFKDRRVLPAKEFGKHFISVFILANMKYLTERVTRQYQNLHQPSANLTKYQSGVYFMGIKLFNSLAAFIKQEFNNYNKFVPLLKKFLCENSFYSLEEFYVTK